MRTLYLYALVSGLDAISDLTGVAGESVMLLDVAGVGVAAGWIEKAPDVTRETLTTQDRVVRELHARAGAVLPCRFGTTAPDVETAARSLEVIHGRLAEQLARVAGRDQMTVRVWRAPHPTDLARADTAPAARVAPAANEGPGAQYLHARAAAHRTPVALHPILEAVADLTHATVVDPGRHAELVGTVYHLIDRGSDEGYRRRLTVAASRLPDFRLRVSGPSPAYAFARD